MKRTTKPFSVEIRKSRVPGQPHHLPPKRLFEPAPVEPAENFQKREPEATTKPSPIPRILPSIVETMWSSSGPAEPVRRTQSADAKSVHDIQSIQIECAKASSRKPRRKAPGGVEQIEFSPIASDLEETPEAELIWPSAGTRTKAVERRLTKRQAAATQLPRHERWKRRLHPASW